jgi:hypothetical protein
MRRRWGRRVLSRAEPAPLRSDKSGEGRKFRSLRRCLLEGLPDHPRFGTVGRIGRGHCAVGPLSAIIRLGGAVGMSPMANPAWLPGWAGFLFQPFPYPGRYLPDGRRLVGVGAGSDWIEYSTIPNPKAAPVRAVQSPPDSPVSIFVSTAPPAAPPRRVSPLRKAGSCSTARPTPAAALSYPAS